MNLKALITTFALLGSTSVAMARPATFSVSARASASWNFGTGYGQAPVVRDHRGPRPVVAPPVVTDGGHEHCDSEPEERMMFPDNNALTSDASVYKGPVPAASRRNGAASFEYGFPASRQWAALTAPTRIDQGRQFIADLPEIGKFTTVRLQNVTGTTAIGDVLIRFANGGEQIVHVNQKLDRSNPTIEIRLQGGSRALQGFVINGSSAYGSAYQVLAL